MSELPKHDSLQKFRSYLDKGEVSTLKAEEFNRWRLGKKCQGELREAADKLWAEYEANPAKASRNLSQSPPPANPAAMPNRQTGRSSPAQAGPQQPQRADNASAGNPSVLGAAFHNPYTFLPFPKSSPRRHPPTPLSIDEQERDRFTGVIDLQIRLLSPLLTTDPTPVRQENQHSTYRALCIGDDVVVPATGIRGALRSLLSVLVGGTLGHIDEEAWLCQGRDARLGPAGNLTRGEIPNRAFLAEVVDPGGSHREGRVRIEDSAHYNLVRADHLEKLSSSLPRPRSGQPISHRWTDPAVTRIVPQESAQNPVKIKLSGRPVNPKGKREGLYFRSERILVLPAHFWAAYQGRHRHSDHPELKKGDLVWLEPSDLSCSRIDRAEQVKSIQWARWGRTGERLLDVVATHHPDFLPDLLNPDGKVDEITDLFGQVPRGDLSKEVGRFQRATGKPAGPFASRVRPENLVFSDAKRLLRECTLAPLAPPHPGCAAFYRDTGVADLGEVAERVSNHKLPLRGYKVYRTTVERGEQAPWRFETQGVYGEDGRPVPNARQRVNKTCQLLPETGAPLGRLRLAVRALTRRELTLLLAACSVDWRLGGGKPFGLGHCRVTSVKVREFLDDGSLAEPMTFSGPTEKVASLPEPWATELASDPQLQQRIELWQASQRPISKLRYPRAVVENKNKKNRGGHVWFQRHAQPKKTSKDGEHPEGLQTFHLAPQGELAANAKNARLRAQPLPPFDPADPQKDQLFGYDLFQGEGSEWNEQASDRRTLVKKLEPFDATKHARAHDQSGGSHGQSRDTREQQRRHDRGGGREPR